MRTDRSSRLPGAKDASPERWDATSPLQASGSGHLTIAGTEDGAEREMPAEPEHVYYSGGTTCLTLLV